MSSINKVILVGNVGQDPEIRSTQDGREIASFSLATTESWKDKNTGERKDKTEWHKISILNDGLAKVIQKYVNKGTKLYVEGQLETRKYTDNKGVEKFSTQVVLKNYSGSLVILSSKNESETESEKNTPEQEIEDDSILF